MMLRPYEPDTDSDSQHIWSTWKDKRYLIGKPPKLPFPIARKNLQEKDHSWGGTEILLVNSICHF